MSGSKRLHGQILGAPSAIGASCHLQLALGDAASPPEFGGEKGQWLLEQVQARKQAHYAAVMMVGQRIFGAPVSDLVADLSRYWADREGAASRSSNTAAPDSV